MLSIENARKEWQRENRFREQMQERKDKRKVGLYARRGMPEGKDERIVRLSFRKGKA